MKGLPDALLVVDAVRDHVAVLEAKKLHIPVFGICDSNANPDEFTACVPANDDAVRSIEIILRTFEQALNASQSRRKTAAAVKPVEAPAERNVIASSF